MTAAILSLVLVSAFLHALWNAVIKRQPDVLLSTAGVLALATLCAAGLVPLASAPAFPRTVAVLWALLAGLCEGGYFLTLALALREAPLGMAYTVARGGSIVAVWPVSRLWLDERLTLASAAGACAVCAGLVLTGLEACPAGPGPEAGRPRAGLAWAVLCALFIAGYHLCYKVALGLGAEPSALFAVSLATALPVNLLWLGPRRALLLLERLRARPLPLAAAGAICTLSFRVFLAALALGGAGLVLTLRNTSVLFAQGLAWAIGERPTRRQIAGAVLVALGATLLGWSCAGS